MAPRRDPEPDPTPDAPTPDAPAVDEKPADMVTLAVGHPYDALVLHDEDGKPLTYTNSDGKDVPLSITSDGTEIPTSLEDQVRAAAKAEGVTIRKVR